MKLRNKETGEIGNLKSFNNDKRVYVWIKKETDFDYIYNSLAELNAEWEDYEEPEEFWYINECGNVLKYKYDGGCSCPILEAEEIGNRFETKEEAEKAVEKLKAWTRLKDKGFRFHDWKEGTTYCLEYEWDGARLYEIEDDLDLLFGGEE